MLAYVFVHQPASGVDAAGYTARLIAFHRALTAAPPAGFVSSRVWRLSIGPLGAAFEDWYLVDDWAALGALNEAAVTGARRESHDAVAALAGDGAGAIYRLIHGTPSITASYRTRVTKPAGVSYETFRPRLWQLAGDSGAVWQRQMVLGPDAEFLIDTPEPPDHRVFDHPVEVIDLHPVHPGGHGSTNS